MHSLPILGIAFLLSGSALVWLSGAFYSSRIRRYLADNAMRQADSTYHVPQLRDYVTARGLAESRGHNPEFLRRYDWMHAAGFCLLATGFVMVLACDLFGVRSGPAGSLAGRFPNWAIAYVLLLLVVELRSVFASGERRVPTWLRVIELTAALGRLAVFASYWIPDEAVGLGKTAPYLFACSWLVFGSQLAWSSLRTEAGQRITKLPDRQRRILTWVTLALMAALNLPLVWFGLKAALRGL